MNESESIHQKSESVYAFHWCDHISFTENKSHDCNNYGWRDRNWQIGEWWILWMAGGGRSSGKLSINLNLSNECERLHCTYPGELI